jgi:hypothetical protein
MPLITDSDERLRVGAYDRPLTTSSLKPRRTLSLMTEEHTNDERAADDALTARLDRPLTELTVDELMALKAEYEARGIAIYNSASTDLLLLAPTRSAKPHRATADLLGQMCEYTLHLDGHGRS